MPELTISINNSTVGALNLGTVLGDLQTNLTILRTGGQEELADELKRLAEAIGQSEALGERRKDALEQVAAISAEAQKPAEKRSLGVIKAIAFALGTTLATVADVSTAWDAVHPLIKTYFGF
jgi:hypothetical protein